MKTMQGIHVTTLTSIMYYSCLQTWRSSGTTSYVQLLVTATTWGKGSSFITWSHWGMRTRLEKEGDIFLSCCRFGFSRRAARIELSTKVCDSYGKAPSTPPVNIYHSQHVCGSTVPSLQREFEQPWFMRCAMQLRGSLMESRVDTELSGRPGNALN